MSQKLINRSEDLRRLRDEGYEISVRDGYVIVQNVPYVNVRREVARAAFVAPLDLAGDQTARPTTHVIYFSGEEPCTKDGEIIQAIVHAADATVRGGVNTTRAFSNKPPEGYRDFYEKFVSYIRIVSGPAEALDHSATARTYPPIPNDDPESPFQYTDTASSRADIVGLSKKFEGQKIAIVGLGGTGSYVLDLVAKTPVAEIHLFDGDLFLQHNAFRAPGAHRLEELATRQNKACYFAATYSVLHRKIVAHEHPIDASNVDELLAFDTIFVCVDSGSVRSVVAKALGTTRIVIDVGMGLNVVDEKLTGILRITTSTPNCPEAISGGTHVSLDDGNAGDVYSRNIQVADLNALNASLAVLQWKKHAGFYDEQGENHMTFTISSSLLTREQIS